ncbi:MAG TPA: hypothetical protein VHH36_01775, partial [Candidatus Thermoplasmatota archaeon]|nr:hypothetical protein [Candidatus Thermoplasmatota archaeon]
VLAALALATLAAPLATAQGGGIFVSVMPDRFDYAPFEHAAGNVSIGNGYDHDVLVNLTIVDPTGELTASIYPDGPVIVPAYATVVVYASVFLPGNVTAGYRNLQVRVLETGGGEATTGWGFRVERPVDVVAPRRANLTAYFAERSVTATPGETLTLRARVDNGDQVSHEADLVVRDPSGRLDPWLSVSRLTIPGGSSANVDVHVQIPQDASSFYSLDLQVGAPGQERASLARIDISAFASPSPPTPPTPRPPTPTTAPPDAPVASGFEATPTSSEARASGGFAAIPVRVVSHADLFQTIRWIVDPDDADGSANHSGDFALAPRATQETSLVYPTLALPPGAHGATVRLYANEDPGTSQAFRVVLLVPDETSPGARVEVRALFETLEAPSGGFARGDVEVANRGDAFVTVRMNGTFAAGDGGIEALTFDTPLLRLRPNSTVLVRANVTLEGETGREDTATLRATVESGGPAEPVVVTIRARVVAPVADAAPGPIEIFASVAAEHPVATASASAGGVAVVAAAVLA